MTSSSLNWWWLHAITVKYEEKKIKKLQVQTEIVAWVVAKKKSMKSDKKVHHAMLIVGRAFSLFNALFA